MSSIRLAWENLDEALKKNSPKSFQSLNGPASADDIAETETAMEAPLPEELKDFFLRHSGEERAGGVLPLFKFHLLLPLVRAGKNSVLAQWKFNCDCATRTQGKKVKTYEGPVRHVVRYPKWIPLATNIGGSGLYYDCDPDEGGTVGQIIEVDYERSRIRVHAKSLLELLEQRLSLLSERAEAAPKLDLNSGVAKAWKRLEDALKAESPESLAALNPPVTSDDLSDFETQIGVKLPQDVKDFFLVHNGETPINDEAEPIFAEAYLIPLLSANAEDSFSEWERGLEMADDDLEMNHEGPVKKVYFSKKWIPFAIDYSGYTLCFDLNPTKGGVAGQVLECDYGGDRGNVIRVIAKSVDDFLTRRAIEIENG